MPDFPFFRDAVYDVETFPNVFTCTIEHIATDHRWIYEISDWRNDAPALVAMLDQMRLHGSRMVGFNNIGFDYPILHFLVTLFRSRGYVTAQDLHARAQEIIGSQDRFAVTIWPSDWMVDQLDLFKVHHFDNVAKATSLKTLEFNMRSALVEDLPFSPFEPLTTRDQVSTLIRYNAHDVSETKRFYHFSKNAILFRDDLSRKIGIDVTNFNDTKIGKQFFINELEKVAPGSCFDRSSGRKVPRQTFRASIPVGSVIFPYVRFERPEFQRVLTYLKSLDITNTRSAPEMKDLSATIDGFTFHFGTGGIHGSITNAAVHADSEHDIIDVDVKSYYPNLAIVNRVFPAHLSDTFCDVYANLYHQRSQYPKKTSENEMFKLALNGVYGDSNNVYGPFLDPAYTMTITINGQLLICMLAESLMALPGVQMIQANTDGVTVRVPKSSRAQFDKVFDDWQKLTGLELETADYRSMFIRDVNSYLAVPVNGKVKRIGAYAYETAAENPATRELGWHKDHSALVVPKAAEAAMLHGTDPVAFVYGHADAFDFMLRAKAPRTSRLELSDGTQLPNTTRYFIARTDRYLFKIMPPLAKNVAIGKTDERKMAINKGWSVKVCNNICDWDWSALDRSYYIEETKKLIGMLS